MRTFHKLYVHIVFSTLGNEPRLLPEQNVVLRSSVQSTIETDGQQLLAMHIAPDHVHVFVQINPHCNIHELVSEIKTISAVYLNVGLKSAHHLKWQSGYAAFSYSASHVESVIRFINNQSHSHSERSFGQEMDDMLDRFEIAYNDEEMRGWLNE